MSALFPLTHSCRWGYLKRFRGLTMYGKLENPSGHRIERIFTRHGPLDDDHTYKVAFVTAQRVPNKFGRNRQQLPVKSIAALRSYLRSPLAGLDQNAGRFIPV